MYMYLVFEGYALEGLGAVHFLPSGVILNFNFKLGNGQTICKCGICSTVAYSTFKNTRTFFRLFFWPTHELKVINHSMLPRFTLSLVTTTWTPFVPMDGGKSPIFLFIFQDFSVIVIFQKMDILIIFL